MCLGYVVCIVPKDKVNELILDTVVSYNAPDKANYVYVSPLMSNCLLTLNSVVREVSRENVTVGMSENRFVANKGIVEVIKRIGFDYEQFIPY